MLESRRVARNLLSARVRASHVRPDWPSDSEQAASSAGVSLTTICSVGVVLDDVPTDLTVDFVLHYHGHARISRIALLLLRCEHTF